MDSEPQPVKAAQLDLDGVLSLVEPFAEWEFLDREDKRAMLTILCPEISVQYYVIKGLTLNLGVGGSASHKGSYPKKAVSPSRGPPSA